MRSTTLRLLLALALCFGFLAACGNDDDGNDNGNGNGNGEASVPDDWETYTDERSGLRFALPSQPEVIEDLVPVEDGGTVELTMHVVEFADGAMLVGFNAVPDTGFDIDGAVEGAADAVGGTIVDRSSSTVEGHDVRDAEATFDASGEEGLVLMRVLIVDDTAVQMQTVGAADAEDELRSRHDAMLAGFEY